MTTTTPRRSAADTRTAILNALEMFAAPAAVAELADTVGMGRSTVTKHLTALEAEERVTRTPGGRDGSRRLPDRWASASDSVPEADQEPDPNGDPGQPGIPDEEARTTHALAPGRDGAAHESAPASRDLPPVPAAPDQDADPASEATPTAPSTTNEEAEAVNRVTGTTRLAPGELKLMVKALLDAQPQEEFGATQISHLLMGRSVGAIQNNLESLRKSGQAELTCERPRRYRSVKR